MSGSSFLTAEAGALNQARREHLGLFLPELIQEHGLGTALDVGCGALGYFARSLADASLETRAIDVRPEHIEAARTLHRDINFGVQDIEDSEFAAAGQSDLVLCFGLLYHLENPFLAVRNLASLTGKFLLLESQVAPTHGMGAVLFEEPQAENQSQRYVVLMPNDQALVKFLYKAGFAAVYEPQQRPRHRDFSSSLARRRVRVVLLASKVGLTGHSRRWGRVEFAHVAEPPAPLVSPVTWYRGPAKLPLMARRAAGMLMRRIGTRRDAVS